MIEAPCLRGRARYERITEGRTDNSHDDAFTHTVRVMDDEEAVEFVAVATPSPEYAIREARGRVLRAHGVPGSAFRAFEALAGARMVAGFTRQVAATVSEGEASPYFVDAAIEVARLARQVAKLPPERAALAATRDPRLCWELDMTGWSDLPDSCFTYSAAGRAMFGTRVVSASARPELYAPPPGMPRVFERRRVARLERHGQRLLLSHALHDDVHGFALTCEVDLESGRIVGADLKTTRLPYAGICTEPQGKVVELVGLPVDASLRKRLQTTLGGIGGCAQLYDLASDLVKLLVVD